MMHVNHGQNEVTATRPIAPAVIARPCRKKEKDEPAPPARAPDEDDDEDGDIATPKRDRDDEAP